MGKRKQHMKYINVGYIALIMQPTTFQHYLTQEDTRLHQAVCKLAMVGELGQNAWQGALRTAAVVNEKTKHLFPHEKLGIVTKNLVSLLGI